MNCDVKKLRCASLRSALQRCGALRSGPDFDQILFGNPPPRIRIGSKSGQNPKIGSVPGLGGGVRRGWVQRGRSGWASSVNPPSGKS